jgi:hypothetical protein
MGGWQKGRVGALKMGMYHGLYCLGGCLPYFPLMVALGWMDVLWMALFAAIIFGESMDLGDLLLYFSCMQNCTYERTSYLHVPFRKRQAPRLNNNKNMTKLNV